jgi:hypothetical protein
MPSTFLISLPLLTKPLAAFVRRKLPFAILWHFVNLKL